MRTFTAILTRTDPADPRFGEPETREVRVEYDEAPRTLRIPRDEVFEVFRLDEHADSEHWARHEVNYVLTGTIPRTGGED